jgi:N-acetylmuramic acid 6-phosphate etherase
MVDVKTSNLKLIDRSRRIFRAILPSTTPLRDEEIDALISSCKGSVKLALVVSKLNCSIPDAEARLASAGGVLKKALVINIESISNTHSLTRKDVGLDVTNYTLCIDAGGTKCAAVIANHSGIVARAESGPCNLSVSILSQSSILLILES